jgi:hypothetical protein
LQTIRTSTALLVTASDSKKKLEPKHAFEGEREATTGSGWWQGGHGVGIGVGVEAELWWQGDHGVGIEGGHGVGIGVGVGVGVGAEVWVRVQAAEWVRPCVFSDPDEGPS